MSARIFIGEAEVDAVPADDRGLAYGDGVFETMRVHAGTLPMWSRHLQRLQHGARRLQLPLPAIECVQARIDECIEGVDAAVLKLLLTRGSGGRGYAPTAMPVPTWTLSLHCLPKLVTRGLRLRWCETRLAVQPVLAGTKHCNRLEQVLARAECDQVDCDEGLMQDTDGKVVCATGANLLVLREGRWSTPPVDACGVAGVCRGWLIEQGLVEVARLSRHEVETAAGLALCNAVRGILPVSELDGHGWQPFADVAALQARLAAAFPMFQMRREVA